MRTATGSSPSFFCPTCPRGPQHPGLLHCAQCGTAKAAVLLPAELACWMLQLQLTQIRPKTESRSRARRHRPSTVVAPATQGTGASTTYRSDHGLLAAERSFGAVQTVRIFAPLPKPLTTHAKTRELRIG